MKSVDTIEIPALAVQQPIGTFFVGVMDARDLVAISVADVRRLNESPVDEYIGIQRRLSHERSSELKKYVNTYDATFPTAVILAVPEENAEWNEATGKLTLRGTPDRPIGQVASILDGQHRVDGLTAVEEGLFQVSVSIFIGADIATQANIFATVNLAQTKVNRSLVYDLLNYEKKRSPQKSAHHITVALDQLEQSPLRHRIKRLGSATDGRTGETITQAAVVESLLQLMSADPIADRNVFLRSFSLDIPSSEEHERYPFRQMFVKQMDTEITKVVLHFFQAVKARWPDSWDDISRRGNVLPKTNGLKALMRFLKPLYLEISKGQREYIPKPAEFLVYLAYVNLDDDDFNITTFPPGTSGESRLYKVLSEALEARKSLGEPAWPRLL